MNRLKFIIYFSISLASLLSACTSTGDVEVDFFQDDNFSFVMDTITTNCVTFKVDSLITNGQQQIVVGKYLDTYLGEVQAESYFQMGIGDAFIPEENSRYDSLEFIIQRVGTYGDTTQFQTLQLFRISEELTLPSDEEFYNVSSRVYDPIPLGEVSYRPNGENLVISIRLDDVLGQTIHQFGIDQDETIGSSEDFAQFLRGLVLTTTESNSFFFSAPIIAEVSEDENATITPVLRLYYTSEEDEALSYDFPVYDTRLQFNRIVSDQTGTPLVSLTEQRDVLTEDSTQQLTFLQAGIGLFTKVTFPHFESIKGFDPQAVLVRAELQIGIAQEAYDGFFPLPPALLLYEAEQANEFGFVFGGEAEPQLPTLFIDDNYETQTRYVFDVTSYMALQLEEEEFDGDDLIIGLFNTNTSVERLFLNGNRADNNPTQLILYFTRFE